MVELLAGSQVAGVRFPSGPQYIINLLRVRRKKGDFPDSLSGLWHSGNAPHSH